MNIDPAEIRRQKRPTFSELCRNGTVKFFPEAREVVELLSRAGKTLAIASGTMVTDITAVLENEKLLDRFEVIAGSDTVPALKPSPDVLLHVARELDIAPSDAVVIEDAEKGIGAARAAGMPVMVVRTPETSAIDFSSADLVLDSHAEWLEMSRRALPR